MSGSGERRIYELGQINFHGHVGENTADYAKQTQRLGRDLALELEVGAAEAYAAMWKLRKHPALRGVKMRVRAALVVRHLRRAGDCARGISAEAVKFNLQYRREFYDTSNGWGRGDGDGGDYDTGGVDL